MTVDRSRISAIFEAAIGMEPQERSAFLTDACAGDEPLRLEVERLLHEDGSTQQFPDRPVTASVGAETTDGGGPRVQDTGTASIRRLIRGRFAIQARLGAGGM